MLWCYITTEPHGNDTIIHGALLSLNPVGVTDYRIGACPYLQRRIRKMYRNPEAGRRGDQQADEG